MKPDWGTVPSVVVIDLDHSVTVPVFHLVLGQFDLPINFVRSDHSFTPGPFTHLGGVGILRACSRLQC
jgi:hypothetical protein